MKIELPTSDSWRIQRSEISGISCVLINPNNIGAEYDRNTLIFRSSIWTEDGYPVSLGFPKFFNLYEQEELVPAPKSLRNAEILEKLDGSLMIMSLFHNQLIIRTRGQFDAAEMENGHELEALKLKYPKVFEYLSTIADDGSANVSLLFEWTSPLNRIVLSYGDGPDIFLLGAIKHQDYSLFKQNELDGLANLLDVKRPKRYKFETIDEMLTAIGALDYQETRKFNSPKEYTSLTDNSRNKDLDKIEGFCVYTNGGQNIFKVKTAFYLACHRFKSEIASIDKVIDLWIVSGAKSFIEFYQYIVDNLDFEIAEMARADASKVADAAKEVNSILEGMKRFVANKLINLGTRKAQAETITAAYGKTERSAFLFALLDGKSISADQKRKLFWQVLKK